MVKITEDAKIRIFSMKSMAHMYGQSDEEFGRYMRGFHQGMLTTLGALSLKDILPKVPPLRPSTIFASFIATYASFLNTERRPRLAKDSEEYVMMYGEEAQEMMVEAEKYLEEFKKAKKAVDH